MRATIEGDTAVVCLLSTAIHGVVCCSNARSRLGHRKRNQRAVRTDCCSRSRQRTVNLYGLNLWGACISRIVRRVVADRSDAICGVRNRGCCTNNRCCGCANGVVDILDTTSTNFICCGDCQGDGRIVPAEIACGDRTRGRGNRGDGLDDSRQERLVGTDGSTRYRAGRQGAQWLDCIKDRSLDLCNRPARHPATEQRSNASHMGRCHRCPTQGCIPGRTDCGR